MEEKLVSNEIGGVDVLGNFISMPFRCPAKIDPRRQQISMCYLH